MVSPGFPYPIGVDQRSIQDGLYISLSVLHKALARIDISSRHMDPVSRYIDRQDVLMLSESRAQRHAFFQSPIIFTATLLEVDVSSFGGTVLLFDIQSKFLKPGSTVYLYSDQGQNSQGIIVSTSQGVTGVHVERRHRFQSGLTLFIKRVCPDTQLLRQKMTLQAIHRYPSILRDLVGMFYSLILPKFLSSLY